MILLESSKHQKYLAQGFKRVFAGTLIVAKVLLCFTDNFGESLSFELHHD